MEFIDYQEAKKLPSFLAVDCYYPSAKTLSHWKGAPCPTELMADTSTEIVLNAIEAMHPFLNEKYVSNNHFDIDGFLGVWSAINPKKALANKQLLVCMAELGDFREIDMNCNQAHRALELVCRINHLEKELFYPPFGEAQEAQQCIEKYAYFLERFDDFLEEVSTENAPWMNEYEQVVSEIAQLNESKNSLQFIDDIRLMIVKAKYPLHYYSLFSGSRHADLVLSIYDNNRYELEYKYTSWVDTKSRFSFPRIDLNPLVNQLNAIEKSDYRWYAEKITDTAPILRLTDQKLSKADRYDHPYTRKILSSSIAPKEFEQLIINYFSNYWHSLERKNNRDWNEIRRINNKLFQEQHSL